MKAASEAQLHTLLGRVALQDQQALRELYDASAGRLLAIAQRTLNDRTQAEDVVQDTFVTVWSKAGQFPLLHTSPMAWLTTLVRHRAIDILRRKRPETPLQWVDAEGQEHQHDVVDESAGPQDLVGQAQEESRLALCLSQEEPDPRAALNLAYFEGLTHEEVAQRMQRPLGTVKAWLRRSLMRLKACLGDLA